MAWWMPVKNVMDGRVGTGELVERMEVEMEEAEVEMETTMDVKLILRQADVLTPLSEQVYGERTIMRIEP